MTTDGGGWTMLQRRFDGSVDFNQNWTTCEYPFGNLTGEHWLGLINMHRLTTSAPQELRVDLEDFQMNTRYARYTTFTVGNATTDYRLQVSGYSGTAGDGMSYSSGKRFSTKDRDHDTHPRSSFDCAAFRKSPWWFDSCTLANLNGKYYHSNVYSVDALNWTPWHSQRSLKKASMKMRRK